MRGQSESGDDRKLSAKSDNIRIKSGTDESHLRRKLREKRPSLVSRHDTPPCHREAPRGGPGRIGWRRGVEALCLVERVRGKPQTA